MTLINDIVSLKKSLGGVQRSMEWANWSSFVETAEQSYIVPVLGEEFYVELITSTEPTPEMEASDIALKKTLIEKLQRASAYYMKAISMFEMSTVIGDAGMMENAPAGAAPMGRWKFLGMLKNSVDYAEKALESALVFLETNKDKELFKTWRESPTYTLTHDSFIASATQLTESFPAAKNSRRLFLALKQYIHNAEEDYIKPLISEVQFKALKEKLLDKESEWNEKELIALRYLRIALANYAFREAIPYMNLNADFHLDSNVYDNLSEVMPDEKRRSEMKLTCEAYYKDNAIKLRNHLDAYASTDIFPEYFNSRLYVKIGKSILNRRPIDTSKPHIII